MLRISLLSSLILTVGFTSIPCLAYSLKDHEQITWSALRGIQPCLHSSVDESQGLQLVRANLWEDKNLLNKWFRYSHFYHPDQDSDLGILRENSRARVSDLEKKIERALLDPAPRKQLLQLLGYLIHHIQDMTVPLHVMPVNHFWTDGFEKLEVSIAPTVSRLSCEALLEEALEISAPSLHHRTAAATLDQTLNGALTASYPWGFRVPLTWFWEEGTRDQFGSYGVLGNSFGLSWLKVPGQNFRIEQQEYISFKASRLAAAEHATRLILLRYWLLGAFDAARQEVL